LQALTAAVAEDQVAITAKGEAEIGPSSPLRPDLMQAVTKITDSMWPGTITVPMMVMGATDGLYLRRAGIPTYGVQGLFMDRSDFRAHGRDERMGVQAFFEGETFLYELVKTLSQ